MIYTVTLNPAVDYIVHLPDFNIGKTNRSICEEIHFGGKGLNVCAVLNELGVSSTALGFVAGDMGNILKSFVKKNNIKEEFILLSSGQTRINIKIKSETESEINASGPTVNIQDLKKLNDKIDFLKSDDILVLAGSSARGIPSDFFEETVEKAHKKCVLTVVDTSGNALKSVLKHKPFLIKPNTDELSEIAGKNLKSKEEIISAALELKKSGTSNVLVSRGADGAVLIDEYNEVHSIKAHKGNVINTTGAGDSMVAGFIYGYINKMSYDEILKFANACGAATSFSDSLAKRKDIFKFINF